MKFLKMQNNKAFLSSNALKIIAAFSMFVDHLAKIVLLPWLVLALSPDLTSGLISKQNFDFISNFIKVDMHEFGRMAMPLFCFLLVEGFKHTKNIKKYILKILLFAIISEPIYDMSINGIKAINADTYPFYYNDQNVLFTFFVGLLMMYVIEKTKQVKAIRQHNIISILATISLVFMFGCIAEVIKSDYGIRGILYVSVFYIFYKNRILQAIAFLCVYVLYTQVYPTLFIYLTLICIVFYNNQKGKHNLKNFFYIFYPLHLFVLYLISLCFIFT